MVNARRSLVLALFGLLLVGGQAAPKKNQPRVDPKADEWLRRMSEQLSKQPNLAVHVRGTYEVVGNDGEKIQLGHESDAWVQRPNKLRSDRAGELATVRFYYDGKDFTIYGEKENVYATAPAPPNLDQALDQARDRLAIEAPAADLVYSDVYRGLMEDVTSGRYLGSVLVDGQRCHHLAYRGREVDWQIWIEDGPKALPCKYLIVSKTMRSQPEFSATFSRWDLRPLGDEIFRFTPPVGAERIEFLSRTKKGKTP